MARIGASLSFSPSSALSAAAATTSSPAISYNHSRAVSRVSILPLRPPKGRPEARGWRLRSTSNVAVVARSGGSSGSRRMQRNPRAADPDYDPALDLDRLKSSSVRLLDEQQNMVGVVSINEAIQKADDAGLVLAVLSVDADPPVLRLFESADYKKHRYEQQKKKRVQQKRSAASRMDTKELKMGYNIDSHDYSVRLKAAQKFLKDGDKVKIVVSLKGRENEFRNIAIELIKRFQSDVGEFIAVNLNVTNNEKALIQLSELTLLATEESKSFRERNIFMVLTPNKVVLQKAQEQPKKKETPAKEVSASLSS